MSLEKPPQNNEPKPEPEKAEDSRVGYLRCLEAMRQELAVGRLEEMVEAGLAAESVQRQIREFYADCVTDADEFCDDPRRWAEKIKAAGRIDEILDRINEIGTGVSGAMRKDREVLFLQELRYSGGCSQ